MERVWQIDEVSMYSITVFRSYLELSHPTHPGSNEMLRPPSFRFASDTAFSARLIGDRLIMTMASGSWPS